ncbi:MAG TPA: glycosyltransferase, partial [Gemmatimonadales bacterium]|nr:glycosyltransferase [Gemmatimonadales bacterium]
MIETVALGLVLLPPGLMLYAYGLYPGLVRAVGWLRPAAPTPGDPPEWPMISIVAPAYNEEKAIARLIESLLAIDYPADRRQILILSD